MIQTPNETTGRMPRARGGFTLIELLVVIAIIAILAAMLLPVLAKSKFRSKVVACTSNYRQWSLMASMYASEFKEVLPGVTLGATGGGQNPWDVGPNFVPVCVNYGLTVPMWFCPVRGEESAAQYASAKTVLGHVLTTPTDLKTYLQSLVGMSGLYVMNHNLWVQRAYPDGTFVPANQGTFSKTDPNVFGWPIKASDRGSAHVPFISDTCFSGYQNGNPGGPSVDNINIMGANNTPGLLAAKKTSGHAFGGALQNVNAAYVDGHVELHKKQKLQCVYIGDAGSGWFY